MMCDLFFRENNIADIHNLVEEDTNRKVGSLFIRSIIVYPKFFLFTQFI
jgi:hypothetical protein